MNDNNKKPLTIFIDGMLPWDSLPGERRRQWIILIILALLCLFLIVLIETTTIPKKDRREAGNTGTSGEAGAGEEEGRATATAATGT